MKRARITVLVALLTAAGGLGITVAAKAADLIHRCYAQDISISPGRSSSAGGSTYQRLDLLNHGAACKFYGDPGVSFKSAPAGEQAGAAAQFDPGATPGLIVLRPGGRAHFRLQTASAGNYPPALCQPQPVQWLGIYLPGDRLQHVLHGQWLACANPAVIQMTVRPVRYGA